MQMTPIQHVRRGSWLARRRVQLLGAMLLAGFLPLGARLLVTPEAYYVSTLHAFYANIVAVWLVLWLRRVSSLIPASARA